MPSTPKVSVCIPIFNGAAYVQDAVDSVFQQEYQDFEIVIVDNCSADETEALVKKLSAQSEKIRFFKNKQNIGLAGNLNKCLEHARGEYIKYLLVDDLLLPGCLKQMATVLDNQPAISLVCGGRYSINNNGMTFSLRYYAKDSQRIAGHNAISRCLFGGNFIGEPTAVMFRKTDLLVRFRDDLPQLMDMELWFKLLEQGDLWSIGAPLCSIRFHNTQTTLANVQSDKLIKDNIRVFLEFVNMPYLRVDPWMKIRHKFLMTYRIWRSRRYISTDFRHETLGQYGFRCLYFTMPVISYFLIVIRIIGRLRGFLFTRSY